MEKIEQSKKDVITDVSLTTRDGGKSLGSSGRSLEDAKSLSLLSALSNGSSQTKRAGGLGLSVRDRIKRRLCRKKNPRTFSSPDTRQRKIPTLQNRFPKNHTWAQSSNSSNTNENNDSIVTRDRERVNKTLDLFRALCKQLLHEGRFKRVDLKAYRIIKANPEFAELGKFIGSVPGVEVGDEFHYRMEVALVSLHKPSEAGIDFMSSGTNDICISIVATDGCGDYSNDMHNPEVLTYCGQGGNVGRGRKEPENQRLEKGNLALKNSIAARNPVRVVRGRRVSGMTGSVYIYDGLYTVETLWQEKAVHGKLVFKFKLRRIPGQPELSRDKWRKILR